MASTKTSDSNPAAATTMTPNETKNTNEETTSQNKGYSLQYEYLVVQAVDRLQHLLKTISEYIPPSVVESAKTVSNKYIKSKIPEHFRLDHPLVNRVLAFVFIFFSIFCPPLAVGLYAFNECKKSHMTTKHTVKVVAATMALCCMLCLFLFVPGILYCWVAILGASNNTIPFWSENKLFSWL